MYFFGVTAGSHLSIYGLYYNIAGFGKTDGPQDQDEDIIVIHLGHLSNEQYNKVAESIMAFMNVRWPNIAHIGIDS